MKDKLRLIGSMLVPITLIFVVMFLLLNTSDETDKQENNVVDDIKIDTKIEYPEWMTYVLDAEIESITLSKMGEEEKVVTLDNEKLKEIFSGLLYENEKVVKYYADSYGYIGGYDLVVAFIKNDMHYKFEIMNGMILCYDEESGRRDNQEFIELISNSDIEVVNETNLDNLEDVDFVYKFLNTKTFDKYIEHS